MRTLHLFTLSASHPVCCYESVSIAAPITTLLFSCSHQLPLSHVLCCLQLQFCMEYPAVGWNLFLFSLLSAVGQLFIFYSLLVFDSLVCTTITTIRKFMTIVISVVFHGNVLSALQWSSVWMVFGAVAYDAGLLQTAVDQVFGVLGMQSPLGKHKAKVEDGSSNGSNGHHGNGNNGVRMSPPLPRRTGSHNTAMHVVRDDVDNDIA